MSSYREGQLITFTCDECGEFFEISGYDFREAWESVKDDGWRCFQNRDGEWEHRCPECVHA